jgi:hypothetical protein
LLPARELWGTALSNSVPPGDTKLDIIEVLADLGDARSAWAAIKICTADGRPLPDWVLNYLAGVAGEIEGAHRRDLLSLWRAVGLYGERKGGAAYDADNDPEFIHARIAQMLAEGEVRNVAEGARRYVERYGRANDPESVRKLYYRGRRKAGPVPEGSEPLTRRQSPLRVRVRG